MTDNVETTIGSAAHEVRVINTIGASMENWQFFTLFAAVILFGIAVLIMLLKLNRSTFDEIGKTDEAELRRQFAELNNRITEFERRIYDKMNDVSDASDREMEQFRVGMNDSLSVRMDFLGKQLSERLSALSENLAIKNDALEKQLSDGLTGIKTGMNEQTLRTEERFKTFEAGHMDQLRLINTTMDSNLRTIRESNDKHLDEIRGIVDEKLQNTLNERITESFKLVNERLAEVYKGLGEMQTLAAGVGDLKKVLSNVKTRGTLGEIQLGAILDEVLASEQFERNFDAGKRSGERVEFAIKLPNSDDAPVYLPIDSKFPADMYLHLTDAYDSGDAAVIDTARKELRETLQRCAKDIHDKYINPPRTTDFAILFLPTEGLYAEAVRIGLVEILQRSFKVNIAGPSTMAALLNSLQMGFRTLAIQKRSSEVWDILAKIKKEFTTFDDVLTSTRKALDKANSDLDKLIGVRTRQILRTLKGVESLPAGTSTSGLPLFDAVDSEDIADL